MSSIPSGTTVVANCANCAGPLEPGTKFCPGCGVATGTLQVPAPVVKPSIVVSSKPATDEISEMERIAAAHPEDESYQKLLAVQLHDDAMKDWWRNPEDGQNLCTSIGQIRHARMQLNRAAALQFNDPELRASIEKLRKVTDSMEQREYTGNWVQIVILGLFYIFPGVIWWYVNRRPAFLINLDYKKSIETGKHPGAGAKMGGAMEKVSDFFDSVTGGWGGWFALAFMVIFSPIFMLLAFKQNYLDVKREYEGS